MPRMKTNVMAVSAAAVSALAIVGGYGVTANAMGNDAPTGKATVEVITAEAPSGDAFRCTLDDIDLGSPDPAAVPGAPGDGSGSSNGSIGTATAIPAMPEPITVEEGDIAPVEIPPGAVEVFDINDFGDIRDGTAEECAEVRASITATTDSAVSPDSGD